MAIIPGVITNPHQVSLIGPRIDQINYQFYADTTAQLSAHTISGNELSLTTAEYNTLALDSHLSVGRDPGFSDQGIYFNMMRPVTNNTHYRRAILYIQDYSYYQTTMLGGVGGTANPAIMPCALYAAACHNYHGSAAENEYGGLNLVKAVAELLKTQTDSNVNDRLFLVMTNGSNCNIAAGACSSFFTWHVGSTGGPIFQPQWVGRNSLHRGDIGVHVRGQAAKIGLDLSTNDHQIGPHSVSAHYVEQAAAASVISDGVYNPKTGFNSAPHYNWHRSNPSVCSGALNSADNCWDMYSYGFGFTGPALVADALGWNSCCGSSEANPSLYYNTSMDHASNAIVYAKTVSAALVAAGKVSLYQMQNLQWINVYFSNTLWAVLSDTWSGYTDIPTQGPNSLSGLFYTLLNVHENCFPSSCTSGGTLSYGLASQIDSPGGLTPMAQFNSVYDADITNQIYDSPTITGPTQFTSPGKYTNWMLSYNGRPAPLQSPALTIKTKIFTGTIGPGLVGGTFLMCGPLGVPTCPSQSTTQHLVKAQHFIMTFPQNIYFHDGVQMNAYDYNFSLYVSDLSLPMSLPDVGTPFAGALAGPAGLIATHIDPLNPFTIDIYVNSTTAFNPSNIIVPVIPQHIFRFFSIDNAYSIASTFDTSFKYSDAILGANGCANCTATNQGTVNNSTQPWLFALPNLEVGTGPFILRSWDGVGQHGLLLRNVNYQRAAWNMNITNNQVTKGSSFTFKRNIYQWAYSTSICASSADKICKVPITSGLTATLYLVNRVTGATINSFPLACNAAGTCSASISTGAGSGFTSTTLGNELKLVASYSFLGVPRVWYELTGVLVHP